MPYIFAEEQIALARALDDPALTPSGEIRGLVRIARALQVVPDPQIDPDFARRLEARLLTAGLPFEDLDELSARRNAAASPMPKVAVSPAPTAAVHVLPRGRFVVRKAVAAAVAAAMLFALPVVASGSALPGSPLYGVKSAMERMELAVARGALADGFVYLKHAARRLDEVDQAIVIGRDSIVASTLRRYDDAIARGTKLILSATVDPVVLARLARELSRGTGWLSQMLGIAPSLVAPAIIDSINSGRALALTVERLLEDDMIAPGTQAAAPAVEAPVAAGPSLPVKVDVNPANGAAHPGASGSTVVPPDQPGGDPGTGSKGARASCLGLIIPDPSAPAATMCAAVESIDDESSQSSEADGSVPAGCPSATTCGIYALDSYRWATTGGAARIPFVVNPVQPWVSAGRAIEDAKAAAAAWSDAASSVRFAYQGTTTSAPTLGDGINQIGWGSPGGLNRVARANILRIGNRIVEADIVLTVSLPWGDSQELNRYDIRSVLVHEFGHWLGIQHLESAGASELSMFARPQPGQTKYATLGLGDVKAVRAAYPCSCAAPSITGDTPASEERAPARSVAAPSASDPSVTGRRAARAPYAQRESNQNQDKTVQVPKGKPAKAGKGT